MKNIEIVQCCAGNGKTYQAVKRMIGNIEYGFGICVSENKYIYLTKLNSVKTTILLQIESQLQQKWGINYNALQNSQICTIQTIDSFIYNLAKSHDEAFNYFQTLAQRVSLQTDADFCNKDTYKQISLNSNTIIIVDEIQDINIDYIKAFITIVNHYGCKLIGYGDALQNITCTFANPVNIYKLAEYQSVIKQYPNNNLCRRLCNTIIRNLINHITGQHIDVLDNSVYNKVKCIEYDSENVSIANKVDALMNVYKKFVCLYNYLPQDFLIISPFMKENSTLNQFNERINSFWKSYYQNTIGIYSEVHTREKTGAIDTTTSINKTRCCSIWTAKGDGRKCVFVLNFNFSTFYKGIDEAVGCRQIDETIGCRQIDEEKLCNNSLNEVDTKTEDLLMMDPGISNVNVALTRAKENLVLCYETFDDDPLLKKLHETPMFLDVFTIKGTKRHKAPKILYFNEYNLSQIFNKLIIHETLQFDNFDKIVQHTKIAEEINQCCASQNTIQVDQKYHYILKAIFNITFWQDLAIASYQYKNGLKSLIYNFITYGEDYVEIATGIKYQQKLQSLFSAHTQCNTQSMLPEKRIFVQHQYIRNTILRFLNSLSQQFTKSNTVKLRTPIDMIVYFYIQQLLSKGINTSFTETMLEECLQVLNPSIKLILTKQDQKLQLYLQKVKRVYPIISKLNSTLPNKFRFHMTRSVLSLAAETQQIQGQSLCCQNFDNDKQYRMGIPIYLDNIFENDKFILCIKLEENISKLNYKELQLNIAIQMNLLYLLTNGQKQIYFYIIDLSEHLPLKPIIFKNTDQDKIIQKYITNYKIYQSITIQQFISKHSIEQQQKLEEKNKKYAKNISQNIDMIKPQEITYISIDTETYCNDDGEWQPIQAGFAVYNKQMKLIGKFQNLVEQSDENKYYHRIGYDSGTKMQLKEIQQILYNWQKQNDEIYLLGTNTMFDVKMLQLSWPTDKIIDIQTICNEKYKYKTLTEIYYQIFQVQCFSGTHYSLYDAIAVGDIYRYLLVNGAI